MDFVGVCKTRLSAFYDEGEFQKGICNLVSEIYFIENECFDKSRDRELIII